MDVANVRRVATQTCPSDRHAEGWPYLGPYRERAIEPTLTSTGGSHAEGVHRKKFDGESQMQHLRPKKRQFVLTKQTICTKLLFVNLSADVAAVFRDYPRIYFSCHRRHVRDPATQALISAHQVGILDHLDANDATMLTELAAHMGVTPSTMSIAVGRLVGQGYVTRTLDVTDRRKVQLRLTDAGVRVRAANSVLEPGLVEDMLGQLSPKDRHDALRGLAILARGAVAAQQTRSRAAKHERGSAI